MYKLLQGFSIDLLWLPEKKKEKAIMRGEMLKHAMRDIKKRSQLIPRDQKKKSQKLKCQEFMKQDFSTQDDQLSKSPIRGLEDLLQQLSACTCFSTIF